MKVKSLEKSIKEISDLKGLIDPKPQYQRTPVWKIDRRKLLINSIIKGYDLPKFYLHQLDNNAFFDFEVCDGQQRLRTIWSFLNDEFPLGINSFFEGTDISKLKFSQLSKRIQTYIYDFKLTIAIIEEATNEEIRDLFARLQKGMGLNQAELRRALSTNIGVYVESVVENHIFFTKCGIDNIRNKHQDYIDHAIAFLVDNFNKDFKGQDLQDIYTKISPIQAIALVKELSNVLDEMTKINSIASGIFKNKWGFLDSFILINQNIKQGLKLKHKEFANALVDFEKGRKFYSKQASKLLEPVKGQSPTEEAKRLYTYIISFVKDGALKKNVEKRNEVFRGQFNYLFN